MYEIKLTEKFVLACFVLVKLCVWIFVSYLIERVVVRKFKVVPEEWPENECGCTVLLRKYDARDFFIYCSTAV